MSETSGPYRPIIGQPYPADPAPPATSHVAERRSARRVLRRIIGVVPPEADPVGQPGPARPDDTMEIPPVPPDLPTSKRRRERQKRRAVRSPFAVDNWRWRVKPDEGHVPPVVLAHCQTLLTESYSGQREDEIYYLDRYHWFELLDKIWLMLIVLVVGTFGGLAALLHRTSGHYGYHEPRTHIYHTIMVWYVPPLVALMLVLISLAGLYLRSYSWRYTFIMITNLTLRLLVLPPTRSLVIKNNIDDNDLNRIESVDMQQDRRGKVFQYADLLVTLVGNDKPKVLPMVSSPLKVKAILDAARRAHHAPVGEDKSAAE